MMRDRGFSEPSKAKRRHRATGRARGKPPFVATQAQRDAVTLCKAAGLTDEQTARQIGTCLATLKRHFRSELDANGDRIHLAVVQNMLKIALNPNHKGCVLASIFWLRSRLNWQKSDVELEVGINGKRKGADQMPVTFTLKLGEIDGSSMPTGAGDAPAPVLHDPLPQPSQPEATSPQEPAVSPGPRAEHRGFGRWFVIDGHGGEIAGPLSRDDAEKIVRAAPTRRLTDDGRCL